MQYLQYKMKDILNYFFFILSSKCDVYFTFSVNFYLDAEFSLEIPDVYLGFTKFTVEIVDSHTKVT